VSAGWLRLEALAPRSPKVSTLSSDAVKWLWVVTLCEAKLQRPGGRFANKAHWATCVGQPAGKQFNELVKVGLLHEAPSLCDQCAGAEGALPHGTILVHGWHDFQIDPSSERVRRYRAKHSETQQGVTGRVPETFHETGTRTKTQTGTVTNTRVSTLKNTPGSLKVYNPLVRGNGVVSVGDVLEAVGKHNGRE
jgi:hypothetical protein